MWAQSANAELRTRKQASRPSPLGSEAKPRVLNESPVDSQTPRCPSPQARQGGPLAVDEVFASLVQREVLSKAKRRDC